MKARRALVSLVAACALLAPLAHAQSFPAKPLRMILPFPAGGGLDATVRAIGQAMSESVGQPVLVENRPGAATIIGMQACARAAPDGYTTCITAADSLSYNPLLYKSLPYEPKDFVPVSHLVRIYALILGRGNAPFSTYKEMLEYARAKPGALNWGTWGPASSPDLLLQWAKLEKGDDIAAIPYKGGGSSAVPALLSGEIDVTLNLIGPSLPLIKAGKMKPLAVIGNKRWPGMPDLPSLAEEGVDPGLASYWAAFAPAATPRPLVVRWNAEFTKALAAPAVQEFLRTQTLEAVGSPVDESAAFLVQDRANAERVFKRLGVKPVDTPN
jgi:tripartite-type tricarboxylate transporter receptor subunit TctC